jgi:hypothetical protein
MESMEQPGGEGEETVPAEAWARLRTALEADEQGRLILGDLARQPNVAQAALSDWLGDRPTGLASIVQVFGGTISQLVVIARAEAVHHYGRIAEVPAPRQLPAPPADFTNRVREADELRRLLDGASDNGALVTLGGQPAVGKTSLALSVARQVGTRYPDGQLYADLGNDESPEPTNRILGAFLRDLGVTPELVPPDADERERLYRTHTTDRRILVVLDNAWTERQVRPLLPAGTGSALLVTSRRRLLALDGALRMWLEVLAPEHAVDLLARIAGDDVVRVDPARARIVAGLCGYLPLALRIVAVRLSTPPHPSLTWMVRKLLDEQRRLEQLHIGDRGVRAAYMISYEHLDDRSRLLFRLLGLVEAPSFTSWMVAALLDTTDGEAERALLVLSDNALLEPIAEDSVGQLRFQFHDLLRAFASEQGRADPDQDLVDAGLRRLMERACGLAAVQSLRILPDSYLRPIHDAGLEALMAGARTSPEIDDPVAWLVEEHTSLFRLAGQAFARGYDSLVWMFALALQDYCELKGHLAVWAELAELAVTSARREGDLVVIGYAVRSLGIAELYRGEHRLAVTHLEEAIRAGEATGEEMLVATSLRAAGESYGQMGEPDRAGSCFSAAEAMFDELEEPVWEAWTLWSRATLGQQIPQEAVESLSRAVRRFEELRESRGIAVTLRSLGLVHMRSGRPQEALRCFEQCLPLFRSIGDRTGEALTMDSLGHLYLDAGRDDEAMPLLEASAPFLSRLGDHQGFL